tara:strand:- start:34 stop:558 length:525 start_codon:yes stop_codon:yes gene_type:complete
MRKTETYFTGIPCRYGHISERYSITKVCVECGKKWHQETKEDRADYYQKNKEDIKAKNKLYQKNYRDTNPIGIMYKSAKARAKRKSLEFNIVPSDIVIPKYCPVFPEIELIRNEGIHKDNSPSLDRIDNNKGYVKGNIQVISYKANNLKNSGNVKDLERLLEYLKLLQEKTEWY